MAGNSVAGLIGKSVLLLLLIFALIIGGILWFDFLNLIDKGNSLDFITNLIGIEQSEPVDDTENSIYLMDSIRILKEREALDRRDRDLLVKEENLNLEIAKNQQFLDELKEKEIALKDKEKSLDEAIKRYADEDANLTRTVENLGGMPPENAVDIMKEYSLIRVVDTLRKEDELAEQNGRDSLSAYWLSLMDADIAAQIQSMMIKKPSN